MGFFRRLVIAVRWTFAPGDNPSPAEQDLQRRLYVTQAELARTTETSERLESQLRVAKVTIEEMAEVIERNLARVKAETAIAQAQEARAGTMKADGGR